MMFHAGGVVVIYCTHLEQLKQLLLLLLLLLYCNMSTGVAADGKLTRSIDDYERITKKQAREKATAAGNPKYNKELV